MTQLIADSGSTKTSWALLNPDGTSRLFQTEGINPVRDDDSTIHRVVQGMLGLLSPHTGTVSVSAIHFYGAGCIAPFSAAVEGALAEAFPSATICVESDLLGAARALWGQEEGIACILGTGSNACFYDGQRILRGVSPLGWILGDEGSGAVLGRLLVGDVLKRQLPQALCTAFHDRFQLTQAQVIEAVYRQPQPNRFLASLVPFLVEHREETSIHQLLLTEFRRFLQRNVLQLSDGGHRSVAFVGGIAHQFQEELSDACENEGLTLRRILRAPIESLVTYHTGECL